MAKGDKSVVYVNRKGTHIAANEWTQKRGNRDYFVVKEYENDTLSVVVEWVGKIQNANVIPNQYWKVFTVKVGNIIIKGDRPGTFVKKLIADPQLTEYFTTENEAIDYYCKVLGDRGLLETFESYEGEITIVEIGNKFTQESVGVVVDLPIASNKPKTNPKDTLFGSW